MCDVHTSRIGAIVMSTFLAAAAVARGQDWPQFRGPGGAGVAPADARVPLTWDAKANVAWKCPLPGPGASSPVTFGAHAYVTCYSGYGIDKDAHGNLPGTYVVDAKPAFKLLARNVIDDDDSVFNGSPAVSRGRMLLRSNKFLYCIAAK